MWCVHKLDLGLYSHPKEFLRNRVKTHVNSKGKKTLPEVQREVGTHNPASPRTVSPTHYWLSYSSPQVFSYELFQPSSVFLWAIPALKCFPMSYSSPQVFSYELFQPSSVFLWAIPALKCFPKSALRKQLSTSILLATIPERCFIRKYLQVSLHALSPRWMVCSKKRQRKGRNQMAEPRNPKLHHHPHSFHGSNTRRVLPSTPSHLLWPNPPCSSVSLSLSLSFSVHF